MGAGRMSGDVEMIFCPVFSYVVLDCIFKYLNNGAKLRFKGNGTFSNFPKKALFTTNKFSLFYAL